MIPAVFEYQRAESIDDALEKLTAANGGGKLIAGGQTLVPLMKRRLIDPRVLIDIARVPGLAGIRETGGRIEIGAATLHCDAAMSPLLREHCPVLSDTAIEIGDSQVRNRGTLGGSLAHADPAADYPAAMLAVDAEIHIGGSRGWRVASACGFFRDLFTTDLAPDEIITSVTFAPVRAAAYVKLPRRASRLPIVGVAAALDLGGGRIRWARIGLTGAGRFAVRLAAAEAALAGVEPSEAAIDAAAKVSATGVDIVTEDFHASADYRRAMIPVFTRRALRRAIARARAA